MDHGGFFVLNGVVNFALSAGISHNKLLAKLASSMNKPDGQAVVLHRAVPAVMQDLPLKKIRNFGGKLGLLLQDMGCATAADVQQLSLQQLSAKCCDAKQAECAPCCAALMPARTHGPTASCRLVICTLRARSFGSHLAGRIARAVVRRPLRNRPVRHALNKQPTLPAPRRWVMRAARGISDEPVTTKDIAKSMLAAKSFAPTSDFQQLERWLRVLCEELANRMATDSALHSRRPKNFVLHYRIEKAGKYSAGGPGESHSRCGVL